MSNIIKVDGNDIDVESLSDKSKYFNAQVGNLNQQIDEAQFKLAQLTAAKQVFENSFIESLNEEDEE